MSGMWDMQTWDDCNAIAGSAGGLNELIRDASQEIDVVSSLSSSLSSTGSSNIRVTATCIRTTASANTGNGVHSVQQ